MKKFIVLVLALCSAAAFAQAESAEDLKPQQSTSMKLYEAESGNHVFIRSKRGYGGVDQSTEADAVIEQPVREIVLVFTELTPDPERAGANIERWDNLLSTYPEFFQEKTKYRQICQCNPAGDESVMKKVQGFYIYYGEEQENRHPVVGHTVESSSPPEQKSATEPAGSVAKENIPVETVSPEEPASAGVETRAAANEEMAENAGSEETKEKPAARPAPVGKTGAKARPRKAREARACRPACFGYGAEDIDAWFQDKITLSKKQKRKGKKLTANVNMQLGFDGTVLRTTVSGPDADFNSAIKAAAMEMTGWKPAVRNGMSVKSQVRFVLTIDDDSKKLATRALILMPRLPAKCVCMSDEEIFGGD